VHLQRAVVSVEGMQSLLGWGFTTGLLVSYLARGGAASGVLLLLYWAQRIPALGQELMLLARQYAGQRNTTWRLLEPLGAREEAEPGAAGIVKPTDAAARATGQGVSVALEGVSVVAGGHTILSELNLTLALGSHVAIVGPSGAGKSSLVGLLLGWHRPVCGRVLIEGRPLEDAHLAWVRQITAWVDPAIQLWNRPLLDNLRYGAPDASAVLVTRALAQAELRDVLDRLPAGLQTPLGEGGGLVSGGEGQRVRLGRALARRGVRLAILDEPFRGLDRTQRRVLLQRARQAWRAATLLCITHDVQSTQAFDRVLVMEEGRIVEDDTPANLAARPASRYRALLDAEAAVQDGMWSSACWRRLHLRAGRIHEEARSVADGSA
jgi:ATP-binding cassette subfamily B protein